MKDIVQRTNHVEIQEAKIQGEYTLAYKDDNKVKYIISKYRPKMDTQKVLPDDMGNKETLWIVFGFLFGYTLEKILDEVGPKAKVLVIEPDEDLFNKQVKLSGNSELLNYANVNVFIGEKFDRLKQLLQREITVEQLDNIKLVYVQQYNELNARYFTKISQLINDARALERVNQVTYNADVDNIAENIIKGAAYINASYDIRQHKQKYKGTPAVIVSAGPSLNKNIHLLKQFKGLIFTGGRTLNNVLAQGVVPDFLVSLDPRKIAYDILKPNDKNNIPLITVAQCNYQITLNNKGPQYFVETHQNLIKDFLGKEVEKLDVGGSVALLCLSAAQYMGCSPIIFIGQDLAYTDGKVHAGGKKTSEELISQYPNSYVVKGYYGKDVLTDITWKMFKEEIERIIKHSPETEFYNCTEGGAYIEGAEHQAFKLLVDNYAYLKKISVKHEAPKQIEQGNIKKILSQEVRNLEKWIELSEKGIKLAKQLGDSYISGQPMNTVDLEEIDLKLKQLPSFLGKYVFMNLYNIINMQVRYKEGLNETPVERGLRISEYKMCVYNALKQAAIKNIQFIKEEFKEN